MYGSTKILCGSDWSLWSLFDVVTVWMKPAIDFWCNLVRVGVRTRNGRLFSFSASWSSMHLAESYGSFEGG